MGKNIKTANDDYYSDIIVPLSSSKNIILFRNMYLFFLFEK